MTAPVHSTQSAGYPVPFVARVLADATREGVRCYGIAGLQGSGKSTLAQQVKALASRQGRSVAVLSIDDFYLDRPERDALGGHVHPLLATRGPPGTHDVALACSILDALVSGLDTALPRFDKLADRRLPHAAWPRSGKVDLVILEGWFNQVPPQDPAELSTPLNVLERDEDPHSIWRRYCNAALAREYPALWTRIDRSLFLRGPGFEVVPGWRWEQECGLQAADPGRRAMNQAQVMRFVQLFERISRQALRTLPRLANVVVTLDAARNILTASGLAATYPDADTR